MYQVLESVIGAALSLPLKVLLVLLFLSFCVVMLPFFLATLGCMGRMRDTGWWVRACAACMTVLSLPAAIPRSPRNP